MLITIVNEAEVIQNLDLLKAIRAISRQIYYDFEPSWHLSAKLRLATTRRSALQQLDPISGGGIIYIRPFATEVFEKDEEISKEHQRILGVPNRGYHTLEPGSLFPIGKVFVNDHLNNVCNDWPVILSHEILEIIANPHLNLRVEAPHFNEKLGRKGKKVYVHREVCDPLQDSYLIDDVPVANFVLPLYFLKNGHETERVDFLGSKELKSFGVKEKGYIPYFDPEDNQEKEYRLPSPRKVVKKQVNGFR